MDQPDREDEPLFTQPVRQITIMVIVLALVTFGAYVAYPRVAPVFLANPLLNGFIGFVFVIGVFACFWQVTQLISSVSWIEGFVAGRPGHVLSKAPRLLAPLAALLRSRGAKMQIGSSSAGSILESVATRIDEARDITRYIGSLLIFLGLLGTFWGLATTVPAVVATIRSLAPQPGEGASEVFSRLMTGLEAQLGGMGVAFASSLMGLAGSLIVGLLELFAGHGQNRFYRELEEWLSTITRLGFSSGEGDGVEVVASGDNGASAAVLEHFAGQMDALQTMFTQSDVSRSLVDERLGQLCDSVDGLIARLEPADGSDSADRAVAALDRVAQGQDRLIASLKADDGAEQAARTAAALQQIAEGQDRLIASLKADDSAEQAARNTAALKRVAEGQERLIAVLAERAEEGGAHVDAESRMRLRSIDVQLLRILEEMSAGRQESLSDLRSDFAALTQAIRQFSRDAAGPGGRGG